MAFMGILLIDLILLALLFAVAVGVIVLIAMALTALISGIILTVKGNKLEGKSKKKTFGIVLIIVAIAIFVPLGIGGYKLFLLYFT